MISHAITEEKHRSNRMYEPFTTVFWVTIGEITISWGITPVEWGLLVCQMVTFRHSVSRFPEILMPKIIHVNTLYITVQFGYPISKSPHVSQINFSHVKVLTVCYGCLQDGAPVDS